MAIFTHTLHAPIPQSCVGGILTIGNFDGVHKGHKSLVMETARQARGIPSVAVTFDPTPTQVLRPEAAGPLLLTVQERTCKLQEYVDHVLVLRTSRELLQLPAREFFEKILLDELKVRGLVEGYNFGFGKNREGTIEVLRQLCTEKNVPLTLMPPCEILGAPVSSSRVRAELLAGRVDIANQLLGTAYWVTGTVGTGAKRGATLGFPTANLHDVATLIPGDGVYAVAASLADHGTLPAAANIGPNPTFGENARKIEVHLIGFNGDLYGKTMTIAFVQKIRNTRPFANVQELVAQIGADVQSAQQILRPS